MELNINNKRISSILANFLNLNSSEIEKHYESIKKSYGDRMESSDSGFVSIEKIKDVQFKEDLTQVNWTNATLIGLDLPLLFESQKPNAKTIVIIGIDPLRKRKDFPNFSSGNIIIGSPYACHSTYYRESKGRTKSYFNFIKHIVSKGYNLYVTDFYKVWMNDQNKTEKERYYLENELETFKIILLQELEIIKPAMIVAFGDLVESLCNEQLKDYKEVKLIKLPHPSMANNNKWKQLLNASPTCEHKVEYLNGQIDKYLT